MLHTADMILEQVRETSDLIVHAVITGILESERGLLHDAAVVTVLTEHVEELIGDRRFRSRVISLHRLLTHLVIDGSHESGLDPVIEQDLMHHERGRRLALCSRDSIEADITLRMGIEHHGQRRKPDPRIGYLNYCAILA